MADQKLSEMTLRSNLAANTRFYVVTFSGSVPEHYATRILDLFGAINANTVINAKLTVNGNTVFAGNRSLCSANAHFSGANTHVHALTANSVKLNDRQTPANSAITINQGRVFFDDNYLYVAVANNEIKRAALSSF